MQIHCPAARFRSVITISPQAIIYMPYPRSQIRISMVKLQSGSRLPQLTDCHKSAPKWPHAKKYTSLHFSLRMAAGGALAAVFLISYNSQAATWMVCIKKALRGSRSPRASTMIFLFFLPGSQMILSFCSLLPRHRCSWLFLYHYAP